MRAAERSERKRGEAEEVDRVATTAEETQRAKKAAVVNFTMERVPARHNINGFYMQDHPDARSRGLSGLGAVFAITRETVDSPILFLVSSRVLCITK